MGPIGCNCPDYCYAEHHREEKYDTFVIRFTDLAGIINFKEVKTAGGSTSALEIFVRNHPGMRPTSIFKHVAKVEEVKAYKIA